MPDERTFIDTNVLVYAYDPDAGAKRDQARDRLSELWEAEIGALSIQVLQEFYVTVTRRIPSPLRRRTARDVIGAYRSWPVHRPNVNDVLAASELEERDRFAF